MNPQNLENTQSSLLIPEKFLDVFVEKTKGRGVSKEDYFVYLLKRYRCLVLWEVFPKSGRAKTRFQDEGQNLVKKNFYPSNADWIEFGILAAWLGISRTALFTWFLILDLAGWDKILAEKFFENGVPPRVSSVRVGIYIATRKTVRADRHIRYKIRP